MLVNLEAKPGEGEVLDWERDYQRRLLAWAIEKVRPEFSDRIWVDLRGDGDRPPRPHGGRRGVRHIKKRGHRGETPGHETPAGEGGVGRCRTLGRRDDGAGEKKLTEVGPERVAPPEHPCPSPYQIPKPSTPGSMVSFRRRGLREVDAYFDANPDELPGSNQFDRLLAEAAAEDTRDDELDALVERFKTNPGMERQWMPSELRLEEILEPPTQAAPGGREILGMLGPLRGGGGDRHGRDGHLVQGAGPRSSTASVALKVLDTATGIEPHGAREVPARGTRGRRSWTTRTSCRSTACTMGSCRTLRCAMPRAELSEDRLVPGRKLELEELKSITRQVASALEAAHEAGIVHRDIKAGEHLVRRGGRAGLGV